MLRSARNDVNLDSNNRKYMRKDSKSFKDSAEYDVQTAGAMFDSGRYIYVIFMCHLSIEKMLKAIAAETIQKNPPKTHDLIYLFKIGQIQMPRDLFDFVAKINNVSIVTRYPEDFSKLIKVYPKNIAKEYLSKTKEVLQCLKKDKRLKE